MTLEELNFELGAMGATLELKIWAPPEVTSRPELLETIRHNKAELIARLRGGREEELTGALRSVLENTKHDRHCQATSYNFDPKRDECECWFGPALITLLGRKPEDVRKVEP